MTHRQGLIAALFLAMGCVAGWAHSARADDRCAALARLPLEDTTLKATSTPAGFNAPPSLWDGFIKPRPAVQPFCRIEGVIHGRTHFEVWLPAPGAWNKRLQGVGVGGMAGVVPYPFLQQAMEAGYAAAGTNLGHESGFFDSSWAVGHPERIRDWGYLSTHEMTVRAKAILRAYYGAPQKWAYFTGCSGGGRQGLMEAQRYPDDYDGIVAGDPTIDFVRLATAGRLWMALNLFRPDGGPGNLSPAKLALVTRAATAACDGLDGVSDGVIEDPRACRFDPGTLACHGAETGECLTDAQVAALRKVYAGAVDSQGRSVFFGYEPGSENRAPFDSSQWDYAAGFVRGIGFQDLSYDPTTFDFDRDIARIAGRDVGGETVSAAIDATNPDLSAFRQRGGKLIHYHGWADGGVPPLSSVHYYEQVVARDGEAGAQAFYRLFMVPGLGHCTGGAGATSFDMLAALKAWVELGQAPGSIPAAHLEAGHETFSRPLCPYPERAVWNGSGDAHEAKNFACKAPPRAGEGA
jgi:feruloyl esterase